MNQRITGAEIVNFISHLQIGLEQGASDDDKLIHRPALALLSVVIQSIVSIAESMASIAADVEALAYEPEEDGGEFKN